MEGEGGCEKCDLAVNVRGPYRRISTDRRWCRESGFLWIWRGHWAMSFGDRGRGGIGWSLED